MSQVTNYEQQAIDFLKETATTFKAVYFQHDFYFPDDKEERDIYKITLKRNGKSYTFKFGQSISNSNYGNNPPTAYDVLACLTKSDPGTFEDFCSEYGYDEDSRKAEKTYKAVKKEWENIERLFGSNEITLLQEIA